MVLLAGLPRTGSTLLANILAQNPAFHVEGNSALCQLMWDAKQSCETNAKEQLIANNKAEQVKNNILSALPALYYPNCAGKVVIDKCRPWVNELNFTLAKKFIDSNIKAIVMVRPIDEILESYVQIVIKNNKSEDIYKTFLSENSELIVSSFLATLSAANQGNPNIIFVSYKTLINNTKNALEKIYNFINVETFNHNLDNIEQVITEDDIVYGLKGLHTIKNKIAVTSKTFTLPEWAKEQCSLMTHSLFNAIQENNDGSLCRT